MSSSSVRIIFFLLYFLIPSLVLAVMASRTKTERFFDLDKNGVLSTYESRLLKTHQHFGWPLADSKLKKEFDFDQDGMLEPQEFEKYQKAKKIGPPRKKLFPKS